MDPHVRQLILHMAANYRRTISLPQMAALVNLSTSRVTHLFTRDTGIGPVAFLRSLRMRKASRLLRETSLSIKEIMHLSGFNDASHFVRDFEQRFGLTPSEYRSRHRLDPA